MLRLRSGHVSFRWHVRGALLSEIHLHGCTTILTTYERARGASPAKPRRLQIEDGVLLKASKLFQACPDRMM
jgi:hypothetical protein